MNNINVKSDKGITIIVLSLTIIMILILATTVVRFAIGDSGIIKESDDTAVQAEISDTIQSIEDAKINAGIRNNDVVTLDTIEEQIIKDGITTQDKVVNKGDYLVVTDVHDRNFKVTKTMVSLINASSNE